YALDRFLTWFQRFRPYIVWVDRTAGALLLLLGVLLLTDRFTLIASYLQGLTPQFLKSRLLGGEKQWLTAIQLERRLAYIRCRRSLIEVTNEDSTEALVISCSRSRRHRIRLRQGRAVGAAGRLDRAQPDPCADGVVGGDEGRAGRAAGATREEGHDPRH